MKLMKRTAFLITLFVWSGCTIAQAKWGTPQDAPRTPATSAKKQWGAAQEGDARAERCANLRRELKEARRAEREGGSTTTADQAALRRQQIAEARQKAGC
jgi:hypothetical protein